MSGPRYVHVDASLDTACDSPWLGQGGRCANCYRQIAVLPPVRTPSPDPARYLDLDSPTTVERLAGALRRSAMSVAFDSDAVPDVAAAILAALRNPTAT